MISVRIILLRIVAITLLLGFIPLSVRAEVEPSDDTTNFLNTCAALAQSISDLSVGDESEFYAEARVVLAEQARVRQFGFKSARYISVTAERLINENAQFDEKAYTKEQLTRYFQDVTRAATNMTCESYVARFINK